MVSSDFITLRNTSLDAGKQDQRCLWSQFPVKYVEALSSLVQAGD